MHGIGEKIKDVAVNVCEKNEQYLLNQKYKIKSRAKNNFL